MNLGKQGEKLFRQIMQNRGYKVVDVSDNPEYWERDIDFIITSPTTGITKTFEVKFDSRIHVTGNLFLEQSNTNSKGGLGWFNFCKADYLAYGDAASRKFYIIPLLELKERVKQLLYRQAFCGQDSIGQLVALDDIKDLIQEL